VAHSTASAAQHMDAIYRYQRYVYDATRKFYLLGRDRLIEELAPSPGDRVLEVACGTGRNLIAAARRYPQARFFGFDISTAMLETAGNSIARARLGDRIRIAPGDATAFSGERLFETAAFDRIFISYALSMIPPWRAALQQALGALAPGGRLLIVDFGEQERLPRWFKRLLRAWLAQFSVEPRDALTTELDRIAAMPGYSVRCTPLYRGYAIYAVVTKQPAA
jgi:S-adenosylmethionine-diacylgycerolhomoserine-N-methlytransferase